MDAVCVVVAEFDDRKDEVFRLVQGVEDFVAGDRDCGGIAPAALHLDEPELSRVWHSTLDIVAELLQLTVGRVVAEAAFNLHDDLASPGRDHRCVGTELGRRPMAPGNPVEQSTGNNH